MSIFELTVLAVCSGLLALIALYASWSFIRVKRLRLYLAKLEGEAIKFAADNQLQESPDFEQTLSAIRSIYAYASMVSLWTGLAVLLYADIKPEEWQRASTDSAFRRINELLAARILIYVTKETLGGLILLGCIFALYPAANSLLFGMRLVRMVGSLTNSKRLPVGPAMH